MLLALSCLLAGCYTSGNKEAATGGGNQDENGQVSMEGLVTPKDKPKVVILTNAGYGDEAWANIIEDQLEKAGFAPEISLLPDYASWRAAVDAKKFDLAITYWNTVTGSPDYAVRSVWHSKGPLNLYGINDPTLDEYIELGSTQTPEEYIETYNKFEDYLVEDKAYVIPIYVSIKTLAVNNEIMNPDTVRISKSRSMCWEQLRFKDESKMASMPFIMSQTASDLTPLDPVRADDGSTFMLNTNSYIRLMNLTDTDEITTDSTLSKAYAISDDGSDFYFLLRDDVFFSKVQNGHAVNTGERVGAEDAVFSLDRMMNKDSVPDHKNFNNFTAMEKSEIVTDLESLKSVPSKQSGKSVYDVLNEGAVAPVTSLTADKAAADNAAGVYQVVHMSTKYAFPQILNVLAHSSGGIVSKKQIETVNAKFLKDPAAYEAGKDVLYGEQSWYTEGASYNNNLVCSGPYIAIKKNDVEIFFEANPGYMPTETKYAPKIKTIQMKFIKDSETVFSALRAGDIYIMYTIPTAKIDMVKEDPKFTFKEIPGNAYNYLAFNFDGIFKSENLRKAAQYAIDQEQISAVFNNRLIPTYSSVTPVLNTGKALKADPQKTAFYLSEWAKETDNY
jgi:peptide/nickel transport system substrate-binding protein